MHTPLPPLICSLVLLLGSAGRLAAADLSASNDSKMSVEVTPFGTTQQGEPVELYTLKNANGVTAKVITYGATIFSLEVPDKDGHFTNVCANCASLTDYENRSPCFGALLGRYANRIAHAQFALDGRTIKLPNNAGRNHIHGGVRGFHKRVWKAKPFRTADAVGLNLTYLAKDGEEGYPGNLTCTVSYQLNNRNEWKMDYTAETDQDTVVNLSNHSYWNLAGALSGTVLDQVLSLNADQYLPADADLIPTGEIVPVAGTPVDFRTPHAIGERLNQIIEKQFGGGYDHCLVIHNPKPGELVVCAHLKDPKSGRTMEVSTTQPGVQIYSANFPTGAFSGPGGYRYPRHLGLCLETQHFPDSPNKPQFPSTELKPGEVYHQTTIHRFGVEP